MVWKEASAHSRASTQRVTGRHPVIKNAKERDRSKPAAYRPARRGPTRYSPARRVRPRRCSCRPVRAGAGGCGLGSLQVAVLERRREQSRRLETRSRLKVSLLQPSAEHQANSPTLPGPTCFFLPPTPLFVGVFFGFFGFFKKNFLHSREGNMCVSTEHRKRDSI